MKKIILFLVILCTALSAKSQTKIDSLKNVLEQTTNKVSRLNTLDVLTKELVRNNSEEQRQYLEEYISLAKDLEAYDLMASKSRFLIQDFIYKGQMEEAKQLCDSLLTFNSYFKKPSSEAHILLKRAATYFDFRKFKEAVKDYDMAASLFLKSGDSIFVADAYLYSAQVDSKTNNFVDALKKLEKASYLYAALGDDLYAIYASLDLSLLYDKNGFIEKGIAEREQLLPEAEETKDYLLCFDISMQNASSYAELFKCDKQKESIDAMIRYKDSMKNSDLKVKQEFLINYHKAIYHINTKHIEKANTYISLLEEDLESSRSKSYNRPLLLYAKARCYDAIKQYNQLIPTLEEIVQTTEINDIKIQLYARQRLSELYHEKGKHQQAFNLINKVSKIKDSIFKAQKTNTFIYYQTEFETEQKRAAIIKQDAEILKLESEKKIAKTKRNYLITSLVAIFLLVITFFYFANRQKIREQAYQNILLNNKVATKTEEVNELLTETIQHIKSKERLAENLQKLSNEKEGITLKSIIADLKASKADNAKLMLIKQNIEQVNFEFIKKLKDLHPELTKTDIEICSLIRIGLSRKEVANLRNTSLEAVKTSRFRLKKKLNLTTEQGLDDYVNTL